jgi:hypothetical protein
VLPDEQPPPGLNRFTSGREAAADMDLTSQASTLTSAELRDLWCARSLSAGWMFASDWLDPAVEALCEACCRGENLWPTAERLGSTRAAAGVSLAETLADVDELTAVLPGLAADVLHRAVSLGWADRMMAPEPSVFDPLTGLVTPDYLRTRLGEIYRAADVADSRVSATHALVVVRVDLSGLTGWDRVTPLILCGDAMRTVFDGGQTLTRIADHMAQALTEREVTLPRRAHLMADMIAQRLARDEPRSGPPRVWIERLPDTPPAALDLIGELGH